jgi:hypothetical protein
MNISFEKRGRPNERQLRNRIAGGWGTPSSNTLLMQIQKAVRSISGCKTKLAAWITTRNSPMTRATLFLLALMLGLPLHAQLPVKTYGQDLADQVVAANPGLLVVMFHVSPPGIPNYPIVASNIGRIGKLADEDDMRVITTEKTNLEVAHGGTRFEVELVMRDATGTNIGALGLVFPYKNGDDKNAIEKKAIGIRDWLAKRILNSATLIEYHPYEPLATTKTHAQKLVDDILSRHSEIIALAMHVTRPKATDNIILASNFGRIGKKADDDDLKVISSGQPIVGVYDEGRRYGVELPLRDAAGQTIGALSVGFRHQSGDDEKAFLSKAEKIRDELQKRIPSLDGLVELDP